MDGPGGISRGPREVVEGIRHVCMRSLGPAMSPFNACLNLNGLETPSLRMERHCADATIRAGAQLLLHRMTGKHTLRRSGEEE